MNMKVKETLNVIFREDGGITLVSLFILGEYLLITKEALRELEIRPLYPLPPITFTWLVVTLVVIPVTYLLINNLLVAYRTLRDKEHKNVGGERNDKRD